MPLLRREFSCIALVRERRVASTSLRETNSLGRFSESQSRNDEQESAEDRQPELNHERAIRFALVSDVLLSAGAATASVDDDCRASVFAED